MQFGLGKQVNSNVARFETGSGLGKHCGIISMDADGWMDGGTSLSTACDWPEGTSIGQLAKNATKTYLATPEPQLQLQLQRKRERELANLPIPQTAPGSMLMLMLILDMERCRMLQPGP
ncbi:hypothetical protein ACLKA6_005938 [Drosophila palustris]